MTIEQQRVILDRTYKQLTEFCGKPPRGNVAPWWESSKEGAELMMKYGIEYGTFPYTYKWPVISTLPFVYRPLVLPRRLPPLLPPYRRYVDAHRLLEAPVALDASSQARSGDRVCGDTIQLVPG